MRSKNLLSMTSLAAATGLGIGRGDEGGGTFCDGQAMPVEQTGENILFVYEEGRTEAHIQIKYDPDTDAGQFAWVIPVTTIPEFAVGSEPLFQNLLAGSVPSYGRDYDLVCDDWGDSTAGSTGTDGGDGDTVHDDGVGGRTAVHDGAAGGWEWDPLPGDDGGCVVT